MTRLHGRMRVTLAATLAAILLDSFPALAQKIYWVDEILGVRRANLDGTQVETHIPRTNYLLRGLSLHLGEEKMYWTNIRSIMRSDLDGSSTETIIADAGDYLEKIEIDAVNGKMYWTEHSMFRIRRANLDGSNVEVVVTTGTGHPDAIALDANEGRIYWLQHPHSGSSYPGKIRRAFLDGSGVEEIVTIPQAAPVAIALDLANGQIYWSDDHLVISRANLDGSQVESLFTTFASDIELDIDQGKIYWTDQTVVRRANIDGSQTETIVNNPYGDSTFDLALDFQHNQLYWTDWVGQRIRRAALDGTGREELLGAVRPARITLDPCSGHWYWVVPEFEFESGAGRIQRADFNGLNIRDIRYVHNAAPTAPAIDHLHEKLYWGDYFGYFGINRIRRTNLDGSNLENLYLAEWYYDIPAIVLNSASFTMSWVESDYHDSTIWIGDLNAIPYQWVTTTDANILAIAVDWPTETVFWAQNRYLGQNDYDGRIRKMGVNGTEDVATSLEWPAAIAYDSLDGKVYWLDVLTRKIQRADSDGSNVEDLVFDVDAPFEPGNLVIDRCQGSADCNLNDRADLCDLFCRTSSDLNSNGVPDECDPDCQPNGITDDIDIAAAWSVDCNANQTPDECDLRDGVSPDCNGSDIPDECELRDGESQDCNGNNTLDECDIATCGGSPACGDCNQNRIPDECDLAAGLLQDSDGDGVPNTCNATIPAASAWGMLVLTLLLLVAGKLRFRALPLAQSQAFPFKLPRRG